MAATLGTNFSCYHIYIPQRSREGLEKEEVQRLVNDFGMTGAVTKTGMVASFIDFKKAYDRVDRRKLWRCLE